MTQEEKDAVFGRAVREYDEAKKELATLREKARQIASYLARLCEKLKMRPESVIFEGKSYDARFSPEAQVHTYYDSRERREFPFKTSLINGEEIANLVKTIQDVIIR